eukprot:TRINITY_DN31721_c0_g1_i1.p2 TRINITY_DN31721_c0_g1~~TRINITY_DN31721_c0_g1_i1.p2  ORF type:complete len:201 (-),score=0.54 TRINITY_DN31721_c0_g1_i1:879-1481(-)
MCAHVHSHAYRISSNCSLLLMKHAIITKIQSWVIFYLVMYWRIQDMNKGTHQIQRALPKSINGRKCSYYSKLKQFQHKWFAENNGLDNSIKDSVKQEENEDSNNGPTNAQANTQELFELMDAKCEEQYKQEYQKIEQQSEQSQHNMFEVLVLYLLLQLDRTNKKIFNLEQRYTQDNTTGTYLEKHLAHQVSRLLSPKKYR